MSEWAEKLREKAASARTFCGMLMDEERIFNLPVEEYPPDGQLVDKWTHLLGHPFLPVKPVFWAVQARAFECLSRAPARRGGVFPIPVGEGKTLISLLAPTVMGSLRPLLLVPATLRKQTLENIEKWSQWYQINMDISVLSYEKLSRPESSVLLTELNPDLIIMDEAHCLSSHNSARTKRIFRFFKKSPCRAVIMSGTLTTSSLMDYSHLVELALRDGSPLPTSFYVKQRWSAVIDPGTEFTDQDWRQIRWLVGKNVEKSQQKKEAQLAFQKRFQSAPGVVASDGKVKVRSSLIYTPWFSEGDTLIDEAVRHLRATWELPDKDMVVDALEMSRALKTLYLGFYYRWVWPNGEPDLEWLQARKAWGAVVRNILTRNVEGRDSPALVEAAAQAGRLSRGVQLVWEEWDNVRHREKPPTQTVWISDSVMKDVVDFARSGTHLIWYRSKAIADKLEELGLTVFRAGEDPPEEAKTCAISDSFGQGIDGLQYLFSSNLLLEPASSGRRWEQTVGRTHREGQKSHCVSVFYTGMRPFMRSFYKAKEEARYIQHSTGTPQKLIYGSFGT